MYLICNGDGIFHEDIESLDGARIAAQDLADDARQSFWLMPYTDGTVERFDPFGDVEDLDFAEAVPANFREAMLMRIRMCGALTIKQERALRVMRGDDDQR